MTDTLPLYCEHIGKLFIQIFEIGSPISNSLGAVCVVLYMYANIHRDDPSNFFIII